MADLWLLCRLIVAVTFCLSAIWKLRNRAEFNAVIAGNSWRLRGSWQRSIRPAVAGLELVIAVGLFALPENWPFGLAAVLFLLAFSVFLARAGSLRNGCGCWRAGRRGSVSARPYLIRNGLLMILAGAGTLQAKGVSAWAEFAIAACAVLPAVLIMEVPAITEQLSTGQPAERTHQAEREPVGVGGIQ